VAAETGMRRNDIVNRVNQLILYVSRTILFRSDLDVYLIRGAMVFTFFAFSIQKWSQYTAEMLVPLISHSPVVFWLLPVFGVRGAGYFLGTTEMIFGFLIFLGYWSPRLGILGALGSIVPRRVILSAQAGPDARGGRDNTELKVWTIQTVGSRFFWRDRWQRGVCQSHPVLRAHAKSYGWAGTVCARSIFRIPFLGN
jgi:hypothetical protein